MTDWFHKLNQNKAVQRGCRVKAETIAKRAQAITNSEGGEANITVQSGVRPKGRAFSYVVTDRPDEEYGGKTAKRTSAVTRAARETR
ncbi:hypothetical protein [Hoyosella altamirensis]|uniref:Uncharacterized protein n=1 Tax=Hoyosella altamirensis TaxID=616997 RepID=A0A839RV67_9ACTN|nr:hypothetical protein [Hoyosella altamirensis]MBB3040146.1 hypothetical protein [Hoyosella altamirensis]